MAVFAALDYRITGVTAEARAAKVKPGETVRIDAAITTDGKPADLHAFRYTVTDPAGKSLEAYRGTILAPAGQATITFPTALNDAGGRYRIEVTDAISHQKATAEFEVEQQELPSTVLSPECASRPAPTVEPVADAGSITRTSTTTEWPSSKLSWWGRR